nr:immunoglobulin light chain junction region [Macaca mulatta]MOX10490.1 immunoglobulin light chain junction region [Macaca mulatta]
CQKYSSPPFAF